ncbi:MULTISPECIES: YjcZ family sporulation protein [Neobacillus]|uniref:YjcZ family sporulation protein n=1 Tax=Neobacillus rhizophilus TaxID=2833579 RepID=A0A942UC87_9BACI|nr:MULTISPECIES: YjcZ family sporulation protein [Neobacillus]MBS4214659.1 YjcZ family sporulation protein [Neobacillus rhizophilus]MBU8918561.1 YjcZ family sporulation protein [Bacillus sp. FJAT-29953]
MDGLGAYGYGGCGCGGYGYGGCGCVSYGYGGFGCGNTFVLIVVLFILLIIVGCACYY